MQGLAVAIGILVLTAFGAGVTELSMAAGRQTADRPARTPAPSVSPSPQATPPTPSPSVAPALANPAPSGLPTAVTNGFVHMRAGTSTNTPIIADLQAGTTVQLTGKAIGLWQPALYNGLNGYIYTPYLNY